MDIATREVASRKELGIFIKLPYKMRGTESNWLPPLLRDEKEYFDSARNPAFRYCRTVMYLAWKGAQPVGRIMGIINTRHNEAQSEKTARFCYLETPNDNEICGALLGAVEDWARREGLNKIIGPFGFSDQDPEGFLVEGFENLATIATYYNPPYVLDLLDRFGYSKEIDWVVYMLDISRPLPEWYMAIYERVRSRTDFRLLEFRKRSELKKHMIPVFELMNESYTEIYGYAPLDKEEMAYVTKKYLPVLDPRFIKMIYDKDRLIGFFIAMPELGEGLKKANGRLFPFGLIHILKAAGRTRQLDLLLGAIRKEYQGRGLDLLMGVPMIESAR